MNALMSKDGMDAIKGKPDPNKITDNGIKSELITELMTPTKLTLA